MLLRLDSMRRKTQDHRFAIDRADRDVEHLSTFHRLHVEVTREARAPIVHGFSGVEQGADRRNRIKMRSRNIVGIGGVCAANVELS